MANYTIELKNLPNNVFNFSYPFYCESPQAKREFEERFIGHYFFHEIGFETIDRFQHVLAERLRLRMPYYQQLYQTEWQQTQKDMMLSKSLVETLTREIILEGSNESSQSSTGTNNVTNEQSQTGTSSSTGTSSGTSSNNVTTKESSLNDGVSFVNLENENLTLHSNQETQVESSSTSSGESTDEQQLTGSQDSTSSSEMSSSGTNQSKQIETQTFLSEGDVGIQTPAYAIAEWRKVIININEMIIKECADLFMQIY